MTERPKLSTGRIVLGLLGVLVVAVLIGGGLGNALATAGLIALLVGCAAAIVGRARWAYIASRKAAGIVAGAGVVALMVGASVATPTASSTASSSTPEATRTTAAPIDNEAAIAAAEAAVVEAETEETVSPEGGADLGPGLLTHAAADEAVTGAQSSTALAALAAIEVKGRAPRTGYDRDLFGSGWVDTDRNGCDTRNDILAAT
jgi:hypothetical protein